jgi:hypothetical protein
VKKLLTKKLLTKEERHQLLSQALMDYEAKHYLQIIAHQTRVIYQLHQELRCLQNQLRPSL